jgi:hypothetical protein
MENKIAACGLDCSKCPMPNIHKDLETANKWVGQFREWKVISDNEGAEEIIARGPYCISCHGDRSKHWSADCWILKCCVDDKGLDNCSQCEEFPCEKLVEWSKENPHYGKALDNLKQMKENR